ncbi:MAG: copper-binding protein [Rhodospirillales bacterium]
MRNPLIAAVSVGALIVALSGAAWAGAGAGPAAALGDAMEGHRIVATSCKQPRTFRRIRMKGGRKFARPGEVFAFEPRILRVRRCEEVEIVLENTDAVRHALMLPGLNPMFMLEFRGPRTQSLRFVTPDEDVTLKFHCHVETHEKMGMHGVIVVGEGGDKKMAHPAQVAATKRLHEGVGVVVALETRDGRVVLDHEEIKGFMAPMVMSYMVTPGTLLQGLAKGDKVHFTIDADKRAIIAIAPVGK